MLHRADASMIWTSFLFDKYNKWLSYNLWFIYIQFYKVLFFFDFKIHKNQEFLNSHLKENFLIKKKYKKFKLLSKTPRFSYYIDLYCFEFLNQLILLNLYFYTTLIFYKKSKLKKNQTVRNTFVYSYSKENDIQLSSIHIKELNEYMYRKFF
jgi:hypothetical protein